MENMEDISIYASEAINYLQNSEVRKAIGLAKQIEYLFPLKPSPLCFTEDPYIVGSLFYELNYQEYKIPLFETLFCFTRVLNNGSAKEKSFAATKMLILLFTNREFSKSLCCQLDRYLENSREIYTDDTYLLAYLYNLGTKTIIGDSENLGIYNIQISSRDESYLSIIKHDISEFIDMTITNEYPLWAWSKLMYSKIMNIEL